MTVVGKLCEAFDVNAGIRQGDSLSALLYNSVLHHVIAALKSDGLNKSNLIGAYPDDIVLMVRTVDALKRTGNGVLPPPRSASREFVFLALLSSSMK